MFVMDRPKVNYDDLSPTYHARYAGESRLNGIARALESFQACTILEVGCGTGRFVESLRETGATVFGADASVGMLSQGAARLGSGRLVAATANQLPFAEGSFDLVCCVNAIHHFEDPRSFIRDAAQLLLPGGFLAIVGIDPRAIRHRYYYEYFEGARDLDLRRYPSFGQLVDWSIEAQLDRVELTIVERPFMRFTGTAILDDPFLAKESNSLLALLPDDVYAEGLQRIEAAANLGAEFYSELSFGMIKGSRSPSASAKGTK